jgi:hypothetical protein
MSRRLMISGNRDIPPMTDQAFIRTNCSFISKPSLPSPLFLPGSLLVLRTPSSSCAQEGSHTRRPDPFQLCVQARPFLLSSTTRNWEFQHNHEETIPCRRVFTRQNGRRPEADSTWGWEVVNDTSLRAWPTHHEHVPNLFEGCPISEERTAHRELQVMVERKGRFELRTRRKRAM